MTASSLSRLRVGWCLLTTTANVGVALTFLALLLLSVAFLLGRLWGYVFTVETLELAAFGLVLIIVASPFTVYFHHPRRATAANAPELLVAMAKCPILLKPRLVVVDLDSPNAFAVGWWPFSFLAVSETLLIAVRSQSSPLDQAALEAIVAHEVGHHILGHSAFMPIFAVTAWVCDRAFALLRSSSLNPNQIPLLLLTLMFAPFLKLIQATLSQEFEIAADAISALYRGTPRDLIQALQALDPGLEQTYSSPLVSILASHPGTAERIQRLKQLQIPAESRLD